MKKRQGISLIVLVITIIVMIILASAVVVTLSNANIIDRAGDAVDKTNIKQVEQIASIAWSEAFLEKYRGADLRDKVYETLREGGVNPYDYNITVTDKGVTVIDKEKAGTLLVGPWELKITKTSGKVTKAVVTNGTVELNVGSTIDYMPGGVGDTNYTEGWKIMGADANGRLLILSNAGVTEEKVELYIRDGWVNAETILDTAAATYADGVLGISSRSIKVEDIDALTGYDKTTFNVGLINEYNTTVTIEWDGSDYPKYTNGSVTGNFSRSHKDSGFRYYDMATSSWKTSYFTTTPTEITKITNDYYGYVGADYMDTTLPAYNMIFQSRSAPYNTVETYWLNSKFINVRTDHVRFGIRSLRNGEVFDDDVYISWHYGNSPEYEVRAVVTLADNVILSESQKNPGTYNIYVND